MSASSTHSLSQDKFLTMAANILYKALLESSRTQARNIYKELARGKTARLTTVQMEDKSTVRIDVALDHSEYRGTLNFGAFRSSLTLLISRLSENLKKEEEITVFSAHSDPNVMIFGVTAITRGDESPNVMVLGADLAADRPSILLKLMYLDHEQFEVDTEASA